MNPTFPWWRHAVFYQVYLRSFADGNGDGTGDIAGLRSRLAYLRGLGIDAIWVNPWYQSPLNDGGYDVADYRSIHPDFGTLEDARLLIEEATELGMGLIVDLVPNHTSSEHAWFQKAVAALPGSPERDRYHFREGRGGHGELPPNDWRSVFGGSAWTRTSDGEWYLHLFDETQPDLNWANPEVRAEFLDILRFWMDLGAAGFRVDVAHALAKETGYPDAGDTGEGPLETPNVEGHPCWDRDEIHEIVREWRSFLDDYPDKVMVAEAWLPSWERMSRYVRSDEYHQTFDFLFLLAPWDAASMRQRIVEAISATEREGSVPTWVLSNHDVVRHPTRYGLPSDVDPKTWLLDGDRSLLDPEAGLRRARAAALLMLALPGSVYLYQGEELGLPEVHDLPVDVLQDPVWIRSGHMMKGRDGCRVPIPWTKSGPSFGFGDDGSWLPQPKEWGALSVESQEGDDSSTLELYRRAIRIRAERLRDDEELVWLDLGDEIVGFGREGGVICVVNYGDEPFPLPEGAVLIASGDLVGDRIPVDTAVWIAEEAG